jgi:hypothetical protein
MKAFIFKHAWKILLLIVVIYFAFTGVQIAKEYIFGLGMAKAKAEMRGTVEKLNVDIATKNRVLVETEAAHTKELTSIAKEHAAEISKYKGDVALFKHQTSDALLAKHAAETEWFQEMSKCEIQNGLKDEEIGRLDLRVTSLIATCRKEAEETAALHGAIVADWEAKYAACEAWSTKLEKKVKPKILEKVIVAGVVVAAFFLGRGIK